MAQSDERITIDKSQRLSVEEVEKWKINAEQGNKESAYYLYNYYLFDVHNEVESWKWLNVAAGNGSEPAFLNYAQLYFGQNLGDQQTAIKYLHLAFQSVDCEIKYSASSLLGDVYSNSKYVGRDAGKARGFYEYAAQYGDMHSYKRLIELSRELKSAEGDSKAYFWEMVYYSKPLAARSEERKDEVIDELRSRYKNLDFMKIDSEVHFYIESMKPCGKKEKR